MLTPHCCAGYRRGPSGRPRPRPCLELGVPGDVGLECCRRAAVAPIRSTVLLGRLEIVIHAQHASAFARKGQRSGAAVADAFAGALAAADDDGDADLSGAYQFTPGIGVRLQYPCKSVSYSNRQGASTDSSVYWNARSLSHACPQTMLQAGQSVKRNKNSACIVNQTKVSFRQQ